VFRWLRRLFLLLVAASVAAGVFGALAYRRWIVELPGEQLSRDSILAIISQESPVLYSDGVTRIGVFFSQEHRAYVRFEDIPKPWIDAIVAAEDKDFFSHKGVDLLGIARAMLRNLEAGQVVAGGSTLTQQTAKNLFYRPDRSLGSKWRELKNALRLEAHYSKQEILEFYANQFHVSANGRGLGIAARYFFDKDPSELDLLECVFLAGMVKAPAAYNPFVGASEEKKALARARAKDRTRYVLDRMLALGSITQADRDRLLGQEIPFRQGKFRYDTSIVLDEVARRLEEAPFPDLFVGLGIDNPSTAGIRIVTTIDAHAQREATYALWHHLSTIGPLLEGLDVTDLLVAPPTSGGDEPAQLAPHEMAIARVTAKEPALTLAIPGGSCVVDDAALQRMASIVAQAEKGEAWRTANGEEVEALADALPVGRFVYASLRQPGVCDLEVRPELQGAVLVLEDGRIRAMVGGNDNKNFNRAVDAKRQLGSTWKPVVYDAAIQLGWTPVDVLDNRRNAFHFEGTWYYPRPDHQSTDFVSMSWAATRSENLASVWLLAHLVDRLTREQLVDVATRVGLGPQRDGESRDAFLARIRDDGGVISTPGRMDEIAFHAVKNEIEEQAPEAERIEIRSLANGRGAATELGKVLKDPAKVQALRATLLGLRGSVDSCRKDLALLRTVVDAGTGAPPDSLKLVSRGGRLLVVCGTAPKDALPIDARFLAGLQEGLALPVALDDASLVIDGRLSVATLDAIDRAMKRRALVLDGADPYEWDVVSYHPDFRLLVGMRYVALLAHRMGVAETIPPVLSLPLGAADITLEEAALLYQGMLGGETFRFPGTETVPSVVPGLRSPGTVPSPDSATLLIAEIRDRDGNLLYRAGPKPEPVVDPVAGRQVGDMLRNVVRWGTGQRAEAAVTLGGVAVPVAGKTGTTNSYKNVAFSGFVPRATSGGFEWGNGFVVTAYVGYDDNRPMKRGGTRIMGSSGALPVWIGTAQGLAANGLLGSAPPAEGKEMIVAPPYRALAIDPATGLVGEATEGPTALVATTDGDAIARRFTPVRVEGETTPRTEPAPSGVPEVDPSEEADLEQVWLEEMEAPPDPRLHPVEVPDVVPDDEVGAAEGSGTG
jgi:membrane peptidoglycan carboxypeptidase